MMAAPYTATATPPRNAFISDLVPQMVLRGGRHAFFRDHSHEYRQQGRLLCATGLLAAACQSDHSTSKAADGVFEGAYGCREE